MWTRGLAAAFVSGRGLRSGSGMPGPLRRRLGGDGGRHLMRERLLGDGASHVRGCRRHYIGDLREQGRRSRQPVYWDCGPAVRPRPALRPSLRALLPSPCATWVVQAASAPSHRRREDAQKTRTEHESPLSVSFSSIGPVSRSRQNKQRISPKSGAPRRRHNTNLPNSTMSDSTCQTQQCLKIRRRITWYWRLTGPVFRSLAAKTRKTTRGKPGKGAAWRNSAPGSFEQEMRECATAIRQNPIARRHF